MCHPGRIEHSAATLGSGRNSEGSAHTIWIEPTNQTGAEAVTDPDGNPDRAVARDSLELPATIAFGFPSEYLHRLVRIVLHPTDLHR